MIARVPLTDDENARLKATILAREAEDKGVTHSNLLGWQSGDDFAALDAAVRTVVAKMEEMGSITAIEDTRPLPGIDWEITVDVAKAGRFGADVATVGGMVQLVTRGILLDTMRVDSSDEEIDIRVRLPEDARVLATLDTMKVRTRDGLVPLSNFVTREPVAKLARIDRVDQKRFYDVRADVETGGRNAEGQPITANERIAAITGWLQTDNPLPAGVDWQWTGDQADQAEAGAFLQVAFSGALGLMFIILLTQFNSFYNSVLVLTAVVLRDRMALTRSSSPSRDACRSWSRPQSERQHRERSRHLKGNIDPANQLR